MFEKTKALCDGFLQQGLIGFDLMICKDGQCVVRHMGGYSDRENQIPVNGNELYDIYSCSKLITCTAALQLWEKGLFRLEDKLSKYMPEFEHMTVKQEDGTIVPAKNPIYIHNLFSMTAGMDYDSNATKRRCLEENDGRCPTREFIRLLAEKPLVYDPGTSWRYSLAHDVIAALVEVISGQNFNDYVTENIFKPMGMTRSTYLPTPEEEAQIIPLYHHNPNTKETTLKPKGNIYRFGPEYCSGGAGCVSTVEDYMKFLEGLRTGKLLKPETVQLMQTNRLTPEQAKGYTVERRGYGLGVRTPFPGNPYTDFGWGGAGGAYLAVDVPNGLTLFFCQHMFFTPIGKALTYGYAFDELKGTHTVIKEDTVNPLY